jgi:hypothetical protein
MRFDTHRVSAYLVNELQKERPRLEVTYDGGDLIRVSLESNETVHIYLIENPITIYEIMGIVVANTGVGIYTLFILWRDLLLPVHGVRYRPNDWMLALLTLHNNKIYAFDAYYGEEFYIFPVYFEGAGVERTIRHGQAIDPTRLFGETIVTNLASIAGAWRMASFETAQQGNDEQEQTRPNVPVVTALSVYYQRLGVSESADRSALKRAYRRLARKYHPDLNDDPAATKHMQQINEAYNLILEDMDRRGVPDD